MAFCPDSNRRSLLPAESHVWAAVAVHPGADVDEVCRRFLRLCGSCDCLKRVKVQGNTRPYSNSSRPHTLIRQKQVWTANCHTRSSIAPWEAKSSRDKSSGAQGTNTASGRAAVSDKGRCVCLWIAMLIASYVDVCGRRHRPGVRHPAVSGAKRFAPGGGVRNSSSGRMVSNKQTCKTAKSCESCE